MFVCFTFVASVIAKRIFLGDTKALNFNSLSGVYTMAKIALS
jgi:hypothetical protein